MSNAMLTDDDLTAKGFAMNNSGTEAIKGDIKLKKEGAFWALETEQGLTFLPYLEDLINIL